MIKDDDWTVWTGWRKASWRLPIRVAIAAGISWGGFGLLLLMTGSLARQVGVPEVRAPWILQSIVGVVSGLVAGLVLSCKLAESTGLVGKQLIIPVIGLFFVAIVALYFLSCSMWPGQGFTLYGYFCLSGIPAAGLGIRQFLVDS